jgi:polysaccharide biosynthesis transport protein
MVEANQRTQAPPQSDDANKLRQYWHVMLERRWLILSVIFFSIVTGAIYAFKATPIFQATARLQIDPESGGVLSLREVSSMGVRDMDYLQTQYKNLLSRSLLDKVIQKLRLDDDERYKDQLDKASRLADDITISPIRLTRLVEVSARHPSAQKSKEIVNQLLEIFLQDNKDRKTYKSMEGYRLLKQEAQTQEIELQQAIQDLQNYRVKQGAVSLEQGNDVVGKGMMAQKDVYEGQRVTAATAARVAEDAIKWRADGKSLADFPEIAKDNQVGTLKARLNQSYAAWSSLTNRYRPLHPKYIELKQSMAADEGSLTREAERVLKGLIGTAEQERVKAEQFRKNFQQAEKEVEQLNELRVKYDVLRGKKERAEQMFQLILAKTKEYDISSKDILQNMTIIDYADMPVKPVKPNKLLVIVASIFGGAFAAFALAFFVNYLDDSIKSQEDVENYLHLPFLGYIPNIKSTSVVERDLQAHLHPTSSAAEGFRTLRAAVALSKNADRLRHVSVSSTIPSEGKSLVASNLAIVSAQTGLKTLLVDADLRRPSVHKAFQMQSPVGLAAYLAERVTSVDEIVHESDVPNMDVVCCGATPSNPSELISSKRMIQFLEEVGRRYDRIVLDCPPVSAVADPLVIGALTDGLVFVTKFNKIRREHALRSVQRIQDAGIHIVGLVLNDIDFEGKDSYYYSYHYYQNRYYSSHYRRRGSAGADKPAAKAPAKAT